MAKAKPINNVDCAGPALIGIKLVLLQRFEEMVSFTQPALDENDSEGIHAMRVASRRLRGCLRDFMPYLGKRGLVSSERQIKKIADALGEVRDLDVAILALEKLGSQTSPAVSTTVQKLIDARRHRRELAHEKLKKTLLTEELNRLASQFENALAATSVRNNAPGEGTSPSYKEVARSVILARLAELEQASASVYAPLDSKPLHEMRIAAKRLRYAIELFQQCFDKDPGPFAKMSSHLQSSLGEVHDCDVWVESLGEELQKTKAGGELDHRQSLSWLLGHFSNVRNRQFQNTLKLWRRWEQRNMGGKLTEAIKS